MFKAGGLVRTVEAAHVYNNKGGIVQTAALEGDIGELQKIHEDLTATVLWFGSNTATSPALDTILPIELDNDLVADLAYDLRESERGQARLIWGMQEQAKVIAEKNAELQELRRKLTK